MANASSVVVRAGTDQFRGLYSNTWLVRATLNADSLSDGAGDTDTVSIRFQNETGGTVDLASATLRLVVVRSIA